MSSISHSSLFLIFIHDSSNRGMYHVSPTADHLAHALGCCSVENVDDAFLTPVAQVSGLYVFPIEESQRITQKLTSIPAFVEAQRVLSQAKAVGASSPEVSDAAN